MIYFENIRICAKSYGYDSSCVSCLIELFLCRFLYEGFVDVFPTIP